MIANTPPLTEVTIMDTEVDPEPKKKPEKKLKRVSSRQLKKQPETGRNAPCPCGSGSKYKKCCLIKRQEYFEKQAEIEKQVEELIEKTVQTDIKESIKKRDNINKF